MASTNKPSREMILVKKYNGHKCETQRLPDSLQQATLETVRLYLPNFFDNSCEVSLEPLPKRLWATSQYDLKFDVPGPKGKNSYPIEVNEYIDAIGFAYEINCETEEYLKGFFLSRV